MKAVVYKGPFDVAVEDVADPRIEEPLDAIVRVATANICGSDLHPYEGRAAPLDAGMVLGHEDISVHPRAGLLDDAHFGAGPVQVMRECS